MTPHPRPSEPANPSDAVPSEAGRVRLASRAATSPADLARLAQDPASTVRAAVALNPTMAQAADRHLLHDPDDRVRALLAAKMARLLPDLAQHELSEAGAHVHHVLRTLAEDAATRVRAALSEALQALDHAPRDVILRLAHDPDTTVSGPVLRCSPLLTDADLLDLLATPPQPYAAVAIAARPGLPSIVAARIAERADTAAVAALLANRTASIQEATLDALIGRAGEHPEWHEPLVCRPSLPPGALHRLAALVAGHLLETLARRSDLPPGLADELRRRLDDQLAGPSSPAHDEVLRRVQALHDRGMLNEALFLQAAASGDVRQTSTILAVAGQVTLATLGRAVALRSAKAIVSLAGRAGFSMQAAMVAQTLLGLAPDEVLQPGPGESFPLTRHEMEWQVEVLAEPVRCPDPQEPAQDPA